MATTVAVKELEADLADYVRRVSEEGEAFIVMEAEQPVAQLLPVPKRASIHHLRDIMDRFASETPQGSRQFADDLEAVQREAMKMNLFNPWEH